MFGKLSKESKFGKLKLKNLICNRCSLDDLFTPDTSKRHVSEMAATEKTTSIPIGIWKMHNTQHSFSYKEFVAAEVACQKKLNRTLGRGSNILWEWAGKGSLLLFFATCHYSKLHRHEQKSRAAFTGTVCVETELLRCIVPQIFLYNHFYCK